MKKIFLPITLFSFFLLAGCAKDSGSPGTPEVTNYPGIGSGSTPGTTPAGSLPGAAGSGLGGTGGSGSMCTSAVTCHSLGKNCGMISDGCGHTLACGSCVAPQICGANGIANVCGVVGSPATGGTGGGSLPGGIGGSSGSGASGGRGGGSAGSAGAPLFGGGGSGGTTPIRVDPPRDGSGGIAGRGGVAGSTPAGGMAGAAGTPPAAGMAGTSGAAGAAVPWDATRDCSALVARASTPQAFLVLPNDLLSALAAYPGRGDVCSRIAANPRWTEYISTINSLPDLTDLNSLQNKLNSLNAQFLDVNRAISDPGFFVRWGRAVKALFCDTGVLNYDNPLCPMSLLLDPETLIDQHQLLNTVCPVFVNDPMVGHRFNLINRYQQMAYMNASVSDEQRTELCRQMGLNTDWMNYRSYVSSNYSTVEGFYLDLLRRQPELMAVITPAMARLVIVTASLAIDGCHPYAFVTSSTVGSGLRRTGNIYVGNTCNDLAHNLTNNADSYTRYQQVIFSPDGSSLAFNRVQVQIPESGSAGSCNYPWEASLSRPCTYPQIALGKFDSLTTFDPSSDGFGPATPLLNSRTKTWYDSLASHTFMDRDAEMQFWSSNPAFSADGNNLFFISKTVLGSQDFEAAMMTSARSATGQFSENLSDSRSVSSRILQKSQAVGVPGSVVFGKMAVSPANSGVNSQRLIFASKSYSGSGSTEPSSRLKVRYLGTADTSTSVVNPLCENSGGCTMENAMQGESPAFSPDGSKLAFTRNNHLYVCDLEFNGSLITVNICRNVQEILAATGLTSSACWNRDGNSLLFLMGNPGSRSVYSIHPDGSNLRTIARSTESVDYSDIACYPNVPVNPNLDLLLFGR